MKRVNRYADLEKEGLGSRFTILRKVKAGDFPQPKVILGRPGWTNDVLEKYLENCPQMKSNAA